MSPTVALICAVLGVLAIAIVSLMLARRRRREHAAGIAKLLESQHEMQRMNAELERRVAECTRQLEAAHRELESFVYAVSHDLRAPLRSMSGFSQILRETAASRLDDKSHQYLQRIDEAGRRMSSLIDSLLSLSRISAGELSVHPVDLHGACEEAALAVRNKYPGREVELQIAPDMKVEADARLLRIAMEHLLDNAWKYTARALPARVQVGVQPSDDGRVYFVRDNGAGFDMAYADKLFTPFQRLHTEPELAGNGIGLVMVQRILARHGGRIWAHARPGEGATFYFTLPA
jgi:light-regulated signal transduction histidine kinase (bacteriophytochrome)